jgi:DNA-binding IclR family transcriptional regulator
MVGKISQNSSAPLHRAFDLLGMISSADYALSISDLKHQSNLPSTTLNRFLRLLCEMGLVYQDKVSGKFIMGRRFVDMAYKTLASATVLPTMREVIQKVVDETGETTNITVLDGYYVKYIERIETKWHHRINLGVGSRLPLHCSASGKLFLSMMRKKQRQTYYHLNTPLKSYTKHTICEPKLLDAEIKQSRKIGYALNEEEHIEGMVAIAVPIKDSLQRIFSTLSVQAPCSRISTQKLIQHVSFLQSSAQTIADIHSDTFA